MLVVNSKRFAGLSVSKLSTASKYLLNPNRVLGLRRPIINPKSAAGRSALVCGLFGRNRQLKVWELGGFLLRASNHATSKKQFREL